LSRRYSGWPAVPGTGPGSGAVTRIIERMRAGEPPGPSPPRPGPSTPRAAARCRPAPPKSQVTQGRASGRDAPPCAAPALKKPAPGGNRSTARSRYSTLIRAVAARLVPNASRVTCPVVSTRCSSSIRSSQRSLAVSRAASAAASSGPRASRPAAGLSR
jgi:hypothetical protein